MSFLLASPACRLLIRHYRKRARPPSSYPSSFRHTSTSPAAAAASVTSSLLDFSHTAGFDASSVQVLPDVITPEEEVRLVAELEGNVRRRRYVDNHWYVGCGRKPKRRRKRE